ncbi:GTP-binding protein [Rhizorhabdus wittichii]|uniref:GTP-binding protein n=1 Tax=Rhizorhabdus wittichii TaxID=160791 RepID=A0A975HGD0_9SPHN|nr:GTP-binding protein [Rhizorhabdus wittichii]QTH24330.1 GTP-binding protein [Rhizorhabdus wittichii]
MPDEAAPIPVLLVTGFLGAGKTTLIGRMLDDPAFAGSALLVNEVGEIGIDQELLVRSGSPPPQLLANGCVCCVMNDDLGLALRDLDLRRRDGSIPPFARVIVETTGVADPAPILARFIADGWIQRHFVLSAVITLVDGVLGAATLRSQPEAASQAAHADAILISKVDLADSGAVDGLRGLLAATAPHATILVAGSEAAAVGRLLEPFRLLGLRAPPDHDHHHHDHALVTTASWRFDDVLPWPVIAGALDDVVTAHRGRLMRIKGLLRVSDTDRPVVIDGVQDLFHPPRLLDRWPSDDRSSRIVMISRDTSSEDAMRALQRALVPVS